MSEKHQFIFAELRFIRELATELAMRVDVLSELILNGPPSYIEDLPNVMIGIGNPWVFELVPDASPVVLQPDEPDDRQYEPMEIEYFYDVDMPHVKEDVSFSS